MITAIIYLNTVFAVEIENTSNNKHSLIRWVNIYRLPFKTNTNQFSQTYSVARSVLLIHIRRIGIGYYIIDTEISSRKKDYVKMIRKMH